jgi:hypothetical protein
MAEILKDSVYYAAKTKLLALGVELAEARNPDKLEAQIIQGAKIHRLCQGIDYEDYLTQQQIDRIVRTLVEVAEINDFPVAPVLGNVAQPSIISGGTTNITQIISSDVTDWSNLDVDSAAAEVLDSFAVTAARGAVWFYTVRKGSNQRSGQVIGAWLSDGSSVSFTEDSTEDIGDTSQVTLSVDYSASLIRLKATVTTDDWIIEGSRLLING